MRYIPYLRGNQIPNCQRQTQHEKTDPVSCKFCTLYLLDMHLQKVGRKFWGNSHHRCVGNHALKSVCKSLENSCNSLIRHDGVCLSILVQLYQIRSLQNFRVSVDHGRDNMLAIKSYEPLM